MNKQMSKKLGALVLASSIVFSSIAQPIHAAPNPGKAEVSTGKMEVATGRTELNKITGVTILNPIPARVDNASTVQLSGTVEIDGPKLELKVNGKVVNAETTKLSGKTWSFKYVHTLNSENLSEKKDEQITVEAYTVYPNGKNAGAVHTSAQPVSQTVDLTPPDIIFNDYNKNWTNQSITVFASINEKGTLNAASHTFDENGSFTFIATDLAGNTSERTVTIDNIDKEAPEAEVSYSTTSPINTDVIVTIKAKEPVTYTNLDELPDTIEFDSNASTLKFTENGSFELKFKDRAGNTGSVHVAVKNIDKVAPVGSLEYSYTKPTNQDVTATLTFTKPVTITNLVDLPDTVTYTKVDNQTYTLTFSENQKVSLEFVDAAGNTGQAEINVANIDKIAPTAKVLYSTDKPTNQDVVVTIEPSEEVTILNNNGSPSITFTENGEFEFLFVDRAGNTGTAQISVQNIDKIAPVITISEYSTEWTNQDITVTARMNEAGSLNEESYTFTENGSFEFVATDLAGNVTRHTVHITNIDKVAPEITVKPYNTDWTNKDITVEVSMNEEGILNTPSHTFTENGTFTFIATDRAGNVTELPVTITNIDKVPPEIIVEDYITSPTNQDITVNVSMNEPGTLNAESYTFKENGEFEFIATDRAGNETKKKIVISNIDKVAPVITVFSYNTSPTNQDVIVTAETNEGTLNATSHKFTENGSFDFIARDDAGNETVVTITITNIDKTPPVITVNPYNTDPTNQDVVVTVTTNEGTLNTTSHTFEENGEFEFVARDEAGNVTVVTITITNIDKTPPVVSNVVNGFAYNTNVTPTFNEGTALLNGEAFTSGTTVSVEGSYTLVVTDAVGNVSTVSFTIDKTAPVVSGVVNNQYYNVDVTPTFNEGMATLDGNTFLSGTVVSAEGTHTLVVRDEAGNETIVTFSIDKTKPSLTNVTAKTTPSQNTATVTGDAEPGAAIEVYSKNSNGTKGGSLGSTTVNPDGRFSISLKDVKNNTELIVTATDKANNTAEVTVTAKNN
ncbi:Ig-like domain-containing protein [Sporosarcina sp. ACRSL]|uniref:Ig-like domain-containing protein n=1 Tax=Sporosarcina sp. ACRSL TaxID=2918215 RepID=UPI001EF56797|nr:Ig-like domain-containing protein [Sporosarcina sp. ACRSL]MCG7344418.1 Ig-like domain-containing protein [Sporosarcina sp. ACRSL]